MKPQFHKLRIKDVRRETEDTVSVELEVSPELVEKYKYKAGQHLNFKAVIDGEEIRRSYSICTGTHQNELRVAIKKQPYGKFSTFANTMLQKGDEIEVMTPSGLFTYDIDENTEKSFLFYAGGSGITPIMSHIKTILHLAPKSNITLVYGNRGYDHVIFFEELEQLKNKNMSKLNIVHVFNEEKIGNEIFEGILNKEKVREIKHTLFKGQDFDEVFICGPQPMIFGVKELFEEEGYGNKQIHFELFSTSEDSDLQSIVETTAEKTTKVDAELVVILDDEETVLSISANGPSILDAAIEAGVDAPYSCKGGVCSTCKAKVLEGEVVMDKNFALEEDELEMGYVLTCQSHPVTDKVVVSYDD